MSTLKLPTILSELAIAGYDGLPLPAVVSRWQEIDLCRAWGIDVKISSGRVYLPYDLDVLVPAWIENETPAISVDLLRVIGFLRIGSTNDEAISRARAGAASGTLIYAEQQTAGRGRHGRKWISAKGAGLYFTLILRPQQPPARWVLLTHVASVALVRTLQQLSEECLVPKALLLDLKWPNDVLLSGKKTAGILLEVVSGVAANTAAVVGVGVNIGQNSVPEGLREQATAVGLESRAAVPRRWLLVRFLHNFQLGYGLFQAGKHNSILEQWKQYSTMWNGVSVRIIEGERIRSGVTCGITELGALQVRTKEGTVETVLAADVSMRRG